MGVAYTGLEAMISRKTREKDRPVKKSAISILVVGLAVLATFPGCVGPTTDADETIDEAGQAFVPAPPPAPVGYWTFDDCDGNIVPNEEGDWGAAALYDGASCGPGGYAGSAGVFDGADDRAQVAYDGAFDFTKAMTVSAWVKPNGTSAPQTLVGKWYAPDSYLLWLSNGSYRFSVALAGGGSFSVSAPATVGVFSRVTGIFGQGYLKIYVDGALIQSASIGGGTLQPSTRPVTIGNHPAWNPFSGAIDEVQLYDVDLTAGGGGYRAKCAGCPNPDACCPL
jgi:hypothetical protein